MLGKPYYLWYVGVVYLWIKGWEWEKVCKQLVGFYLNVQISSDSAPELSLNYPIGVIHKAQQTVHSGLAEARRGYDFLGYCFER